MNGPHSRRLAWCGLLMAWGCTADEVQPVAPVEGSECPIGVACVASFPPSSENGGASATRTPPPVIPAAAPRAMNEGSPSDLPGLGVTAPASSGVHAVDAGSGADAAVAIADRCDVGVYDPSHPPAALALTGDLGAHDPVIIAANGRYHYFSTGNGISVKSSPDLLRWTREPEVFPDTPPWFLASVPAYEPRNIWAPDVSHFGGLYHLYYSVSSFGSNRSCIGHATRESLDSGAWQDHEAAFCSNAPGQTDDYNAIDPNVIVDEAGTPWLAFGSFWSGIKILRLALSGDRADNDVHALASRGGDSIEAPFIVRRCGFYYLFVSFGACCRGADSTYNINVGRSENLLGPYVARDGRALLEGGGTLVLSAGGSWVGPGHNAVLIEGTRAYNIYHAYAASNGASQLRISELVWDAEGWPLSGGP